MCLCHRHVRDSVSYCTNKMYYSTARRSLPCASELSPLERVFPRRKDYVPPSHENAQSLSYSHVPQMPPRFRCNGREHQKDRQDGFLSQQQANVVIKRKKIDKLEDIEVGVFRPSLFPADKMTIC